MPLREHLLELRKRVGRAVIGLLLGAILGWVLYQPIFEILQRPVTQLQEERGLLIGLNFAGVLAAFDMQVKVSLFVGVLVSSPWWVYQLWAFITPGLTRRERLVTVGFLAAAEPRLSLALSPARSFTHAQISSPYLASGTPTTATSSILGWVNRNSSISRG